MRCREHGGLPMGEHIYVDALELVGKGVEVIGAVEHKVASQWASKCTSRMVPLNSRRESRSDGCGISDTRGRPPRLPNSWRDC